MPETSDLLFSAARPRKGKGARKRLKVARAQVRRQQRTSGKRKAR